MITSANSPIDFSFIVTIIIVLFLSLVLLYYLYSIYRKSFKQTIQKQIDFDMNYIEKETDFLYIWYLLKDYTLLYDKYITGKISRQMKKQIHPVVFQQLMSDGPHAYKLEEIEENWINLHTKCIQWLKTNQLDTRLFEKINAVILIGLRRLQELSRDKTK